MQPLPGFLCEFIDALAFQEELDEAQLEWENWKQQFTEFQDEESDYTLSQQDAAHQEELPYLLNNLEIAVSSALNGEGNVDLLLERSVEFFAVHDPYIAERRRPYFVRDTHIENLLKVCMCYLHGRAELAAVKKRTEAARASLRTLELAPIEESASLLSSAAQAIEAIEMVDSPAERKSLEASSLKLKDAIGKWEQAAGAVLGPVPDIPILGEALTLLDRADYDRWESFCEQSWPDFVNFWEERQDGWLLRPDCYDEQLQQAELIVELLGQALESYGEDPAPVWESVNNLEAWFRELPSHQLNLANLALSPYAQEGQLAVNLMQGLCPGYAAQSLVNSIRAAGHDAPALVRDFAERLDSYLEEPEPLILLTALDTLIREVELSTNTVVCSDCQARMDLHQRVCPKCGAKVEFSTMSG